MKFKKTLLLYIMFTIVSCDTLFVNEDELDELNKLLQELSLYGDYTMIYDVDDLKDISNDLDGKFLLANNLDVWDGESWEPIGDDGTGFSGTFDGGGYIIYNLITTDSTADYQGLFGVIDTEGVVGNVALESGMIVADSFAGSIGGMNYGTIQYCSNTGSVSGSGTVGESIGGLVGSNYGTIENCYNRGSVSGTSYVGGLIGSNESTGNIENCYNTGSATSGDLGTNSGTYTGLVVESGASTGSPYTIETSSEDMLLSDTYTDLGWDFSNIWAMSSSVNDGYPYLR